MNTAEVSDILRGSQRDELFVNNIQDDLQLFYKVLSPRNYPLRQTAPTVANAWYYLITSLGNVQTLGEEYTGTIRIDKENRIPGKFLHSIWLVLYLGGEPMLDRLIKKLKNQINNSQKITENSKSFFVNILNFVSNNKLKFNRIHKALFYINGKYYNVSNRITGIRYVLVREWLKDDTFTGSFRSLGYLSLFYTLFSMVHSLMTSHSGNSEMQTSTSLVSTKYCPLCTENLKSASATPCGHIFCWNCIYDCLSYQKNCPICREEIGHSRIYFLQNYVIITAKQSNLSELNIKKLEEDSLTPDVFDEEAALREEEIQRKRNKSRLKTADFNMLHEQNPYSEPTNWHHGTLKYLRRTYGRYGSESGIDPAICWPTEKELSETMEYEKVKYPYKILEVAAAAREKRKQENEAVLARQESIVQKIAKLDDLKKDLANRIAKKEAEANAAKDRKERLVEEVRRHFGYTVDPRDEKFKEMLEKKEKEQKKQMKEARKKEKQEQMLGKLLKKKDEPKTKVEQPNE
ncbi:unnamed protein product [Brassicogethes aeneus]|uniref:RING-type E3 ubiquitin transferase n=1 Tax=Brassicogethes aeneus TaxID=1431903 RepID=A0A9P0B1L9_BRAAE|nr:unnamed protein product [Brassicogethes aeneus]